MEENIPPRVHVSTDQMDEEAEEQVGRVGSSRRRMTVRSSNSLACVALLRSFSFFPRNSKPRQNNRFPFRCLDTKLLRTLL
jgi:hypothetical protein